MESNKEYYLERVKSDSYHRDPDHTKVAREFYAKFWGQSLSGKIEDYDGSVGNYRGDTIISFTTTAGCLIRLLPAYPDDIVMPKYKRQRLAIIKKSNYVPQSIKKQLEILYQSYHSRANFMPLAHEKWYHRPTINLNKAKGSAMGKYHDYPDLFFRDIKELQYSSTSTAESMPLVFESEINQLYFERFENWKSFVEKNYLQDYFSDRNYEKFIQLAPTSDNMPYRKRKLSAQDREECILQIEQFLENANIIIDKRASRLRAAEEKFH